MRRCLLRAGGSSTIFTGRTSSLNYMTPAAFAATCIPLVSATPGHQEYTTDIVDNFLIANENKNHGQKVSVAPTDLSPQLSCESKKGDKSKRGSIRV